MSTTGTPDDGHVVDTELDGAADEHRPDQVPDVDGDPNSPDVSIDEVDLTPYPLPAEDDVDEDGDR